MPLRLLQGQEEDADFNLARRESAGVIAPIAAGERARIESMVAELRQLGVEAEGPAELARALPFDIRRTRETSELAAVS